MINNLGPASARRLVPAHAEAPLFDCLRDFVERGQAPFFSPGHKGGRSLDPWFRENIAAIDLNNLPDTDTLHCPSGPIAEAEQLIADAWGASESFMLVQGSTAGNIAMALATLKPGDKVLIQRNAHKSVISGLIQTGAVPVWMQPHWDPDFGLAHGLDALQVDKTLTETRAKAVWILHPTYYGSVSDLLAIKAVCDKHDAILLVDGAHSPHFAFHPDLPIAAERSGAAAVVQSVHKILSGLSQAALLHIDGKRIETGTMRRALQLIQTTSPHFGIMASIDLARRQMATEGEAIMGRTLALARRARHELAAIPGIRLLGREHALGAGRGFFDLDETKLVIGISGIGMDGRHAQSVLNRVYGVQPELGGTDHVLCILTLGNTDEDVDRLVAAFKDMAQEGSDRRAVRTDGRLAVEALRLLPELVIPPRDAFFAEEETVAFDDAIGRIVAEVVTPYPPGIPLLMPGERINTDVASLLKALARADTPISASDPQLDTVKVVK